MLALATAATAAGATARSPTRLAAAYARNPADALGAHTPSTSRHKGRPPHASSELPHSNRTSAKTGTASNSAGSGRYAYPVASVHPRSPSYIANGPSNTTRMAGTRLKESLPHQIGCTARPSRNGTAHTAVNTAQHPANASTAISSALRGGQAAVSAVGGIM